MARNWATIVILSMWVIAAGCRRDERGTPKDTADAGVTEVAAPRSSSMVTPDQVEAYVAYRREVGVRPEVRKAAGWKTLRDEAHAEEVALKHAGLSDDSLDAVEGLVSAVTGKLRLAQASQVDDTLATYEKVRAELPTAQRASLDPTLKELRLRRAQLSALEAERKQYGDAAVDALLRHREVLK